jgi:peptide/nickel transport system substrate-binding protein
VSDDGLTYTFKIRDGITFHSGNALTAADAAWSLQRVVKLNLTPGFILTQFGFTAENVDQRIRATDERTLQIETDQAYAPTFVLYCLTAGVGAIVDSALVKEHEVNGDFGHEWLKVNSAGSGPYKLNAWRANEALILDRYDGYWQGKAGLARIFIQHVPDPSAQRLLLENGDVDVARNLSSDQLAAVRGTEGIRIVEAPKGGIWYIGLNMKREPFQKPEVRQALKYLVDYEGIGATIQNGLAVIHQSFLPSGFLGAIDDKPFTYDPAKARELLAAAGYPDGFAITMDARNTSPTIDMAQAIQASFAEAGVQVEIIPGDGQQTLTRYRARNHDMYIGEWGPDYQDPHTNADTFANNPDNSDDAASKPLAWRNSWDIPELSARTMAAVMERDPAGRARMYEEIQREHQETSPFIIMFQKIEIVAERENVTGLIWGPSFDDNRYWKATKQ